MKRKKDTSGEIISMILVCAAVATFFVMALTNTPL